MRRRAFTSPESRNDSNSDGTRSAKDILLQLDPNFSRAVGILNKYMPTDESSTYNPDDLNQNKALGTDSELNSLSHGNLASESHDGKHRVESEQRGGSTMSDLHNTEYMDEFKDMKSKTSPNVKTVSSRGTDLVSSQRTPPALVRSPKSESEAPATAASVFQKASSESSKRNAGPPSRTKLAERPQSSGAEKPNVRKQASKSTPKATPKSSGKKASTIGGTPGSSIVSSTRTESSERSKARSQGRTSEQDGDDDEEDEDEEESDSESYSNTFMDPDPTALRDLDNASPKTVALCNKHQCHYCFFVYFPSATVDEDLMPFRRKAFADKVSRLQNPEHVREVKETKCARDAYADRRIRCIERQSGTQIRLSDLDPNAAFVKGLPRRRLTIAGPSFANIGCAMNLFEHLLPRVIKNANFPYRLPEGSSTRFAAGNRISSAHKWDVGRSDGTVTLRAQLDDKGGWRSFLVSNK